tara:strand:- start:2892 stop:4025 length:1134 start_codon:yes stop_codon:yes gene_type:complete
MRPLFQWAGGKTKLLKQYEPAGVYPNTFSSYHEPFLGAGALFIEMYQRNPDAKFFLNDINGGIMGIYEAIRDDIDLFCFHLDFYEREYLPLLSPPHPKKINRKQKKAIAHSHRSLEAGYKLDSNPKRKYDWPTIYAHHPTRRHYYFMLRDRHAWEHSSMTRTEEAAALYFLLKTGFNGIWQVNVNTNQRYGTPCGLLQETSSVYDKANILAWHDALQKCALNAHGYHKELAAIGPGSFVFLDPPYRESYADYGTVAHDEFQEDVLGFLREAKSKGAYVLLSNRESPDAFFHNRKEDNQILTFDVKYTLGRCKAQTTVSYAYPPFAPVLSPSQKYFFDKAAAKKTATTNTKVKAKEILMIGLDSQYKSCYINNRNKQE